MAQKKKKIDMKQGWCNVKLKLPTHVSEEVNRLMVKGKPLKPEILANFICEKMGFENAFDIEINP